MREGKVTVFFKGRPIEAHESDTVASALYRAGVRIFSRSFKYHRPRGLLCCAGCCPNCLMNVDGVPNVRTCITPVREGMQVKHQNAYPSLEHDWLAIAERFGWLMPVGFYYKTFTHPKVWRFVEPIIRKVAGVGEITNHEPKTTNHEYEHLYLHTDVAVIGGGAAGMTAAVEAAKAGAEVMLFECEPELGGWLRYQAPSDENRAQLERLTSTVRDCPNLQVFTNATCFGLYEGNLLGIVQRNHESRITNQESAVERLIHLRAKRIVVATGAYEVPLVFENNDLPGVMLSSAVQRLINLHGIKPAERAVIVTHKQDGGRVGEDLRAAGVQVVAVVPPDAVVAATGQKHVSGIRTTERHIACDLIVACGDRVPDAGLIAQAGGKLEWDEERGAFVPKQLPPHVTAVGDVTGELMGNWEIRKLGNRVPSFPVSQFPSSPVSQFPSSPVPQFPSFPVSQFPSSPVSQFPITPKRSFVCLCEDVTVKDLYDAVGEGFDHIETLKRYTTVTMGPCQGKMCQLASIGICARQTNRTMGKTGTTTARPPTSPVSLGALAGARHHPVKRTPMHCKHEELGAVWMDMGEWKRPLYYRRLQIADCKLQTQQSEIRNLKSEIEQEYRAVRERVGIIDVSTLGKIDVKGKDAPKLLDKVYTNRLSDLRVGRVRYSVICDDAGIILDDGTISRLADDHFFITTTTGNIEFVQQWLEWWAVGTGWCVHVTNVTGGLAAVNVAGPKAREVLSKLTDCDLSTQAFPYMACRQADMAGVPCLLLRIGFVGETGWEIHFPAEYGEYLWDVLMEAGKGFGIRPFGVEAQRLLRLEKKHIIVGVDTDATSNLIEADMAWVAKLDKDDFIGKTAILRVQARGLREKLVGFIMQDAAVPEDGAAIVLNGKPIGRVTSARFSPVNGKAVGLAWVPAELATDGQEVQVHVNGRLVKAQILPDPFYDLEGKRLRS